MTVYERLDALQRIGIKLGLRNIKTILEALGNPQKQFPSILVAGTNGKGSVAAMLEIILRKHGQRTASYTSPHLVNLTERIKVDGQPIDEESFESVLKEALDATDKLVRKGKLENTATYFEVLTAAALLHFAKQKVETAIVEVGLGGRFDATNVVSQKLSIITTISYDHEEFLGKSLAQIAAEKAGILKEPGPLICGDVPPEARDVILNAAARMHATVFSANPENIANVTLMDGFPEFDYLPWGRRVHVNLRGRHQVHNAMLVLLACERLNLDREKVLLALREVQWPARLELLFEAPPVLLDCAHNPLGVQSLAQYATDSGWGRVVALFTAMKDKRISSMLKAIAPRIDTIFLTRVDPFTRCASAEALIDACNASALNSRFVEPAPEAYRIAMEDAQSRQLPLLIFGSIYLAGEIYRVLGRQA